MLVLSLILLASVVMLILKLAGVFDKGVMGTTTSAPMPVVATTTTAATTTTGGAGDGGIVDAVSKGLSKPAIAGISVGAVVFLSAVAAYLVLTKTERGRMFRYDLDSRVRLPKYGPQTLEATLKSEQKKQKSSVETGNYDAISQDMVRI
jgi:hypothetical protein